MISITNELLDDVAREVGEYLTHYIDGSTTVVVTPSMVEQVLDNCEPALLRASFGDSADWVAKLIRQAAADQAGRGELTMHRQVRIKAPDWDTRQRISVDEAMAPLLREVWRRGIPTWASCQDFGGSGCAYIVFPLPGMARAFCYEAIGLADDLPDGWRTKPMTGTLPGLDEPCQAVWFPRELLGAMRATTTGGQRP